MILLLFPDGRDGTMSARPPQLVPILSQVNVHVGLRPEAFYPRTATETFQADVPPVDLRIDPPAAIQAFNITRTKSTFTVTFRDKSKAIIVSRNFHLVGPSF